MSEEKQNYIPIDSFPEEAPPEWLAWSNPKNAGIKIKTGDEEIDNIDFDEDKETEKLNIKADSMLNGDEVVSIMDIKENLSTADRFPIGFDIFDEAMNGGFKAGDLIIVSGQPGVGKTTLAQTMTFNLCENKIPCLWFSFEVTLPELKKKFVNMGIDKNFMTYVPKKNSSGSVSWIKSKYIEGSDKYMTQVVFIDMIDNISPAENNHGDNREQTMKNIAKELKDLALEFNIAVVLMVHLKKTELMKEPDMTDIGYSAGIYQLADYVYMIYKEPVKTAKLAETNPTGYMDNKPVIIKIEKNRETGKRAYVQADFSLGRLIELTTSYDGDFSQ